MTDGILLAEIQHDRMLRAYDTIIIDEAHERSLNIDFLLGYLKQLLPRRPDLKVVITSATIDPERFSRHFATPDGAPVVEVSGRTYPVEVRYRPLALDRADEPDADAATIRDQIAGDLRRGGRAAAPKGPATSWSSSPASGRSATPRTRCGKLATCRQHRDPAAVRPAVRRRAAPGVPAAHRAAGSCWPPTSPRRR